VAGGMPLATSAHHPAASFHFYGHPVSAEKYVYLVEALCQSVGLPDADHILETRSIEVEGFDVRLDHFEGDENAIYLNFEYGAVTAGRTQTVFRLMLEANLLIYAQDQAQRRGTCRSALTLCRAWMLLAEKHLRVAR
jgi:hypothetical protein